MIKTKKFSIIQDLKSIPQLMSVAIQNSQSLSMPPSQMPVLLQYINHLLKQEAGEGQQVNVVSLMVHTDKETNENSGESFLAAFCVCATQSSSPYRLHFNLLFSMLCQASLSSFISFLLILYPANVA